MLQNTPQFRPVSISRRRACAATLAVGSALLFGAPARAQSHETTQAGYTVRSTLVASTQLPAASLRQQGIEAAPDQAVLNVVVLQDGAGPASQTVRAKVEASVRDLTGQSRPIDLRDVDVNERVSYLGLVQHAPNETLTVRIQVTPTGSSQPIELSYQEQTRR